VENVFLKLLESVKSRDKKFQILQVIEHILSNN